MGCRVRQRRRNSGIFRRLASKYTPAISAYRRPFLARPTPAAKNAVGLIAESIENMLAIESQAERYSLRHAAVDRSYKYTSENESREIWNAWT